MFNKCINIIKFYVSQLVGLKRNLKSKESLFVLNHELNTTNKYLNTYNKNKVQSLQQF